MTIRLNRCPHCRSAAAAIHRLPILPADSPEDDVYYAECPECGHYGPDAGTEEAARQVWNRMSMQEVRHG